MVLKKPKVLMLTFAAGVLPGCTTPTAAALNSMPASGCPVAAWSFVRWNDAYGLNVVALVQAVPGWTFSFSPDATVINGTAGEHSEVRVVLIPAPIDKNHPPRTSDQHIYGYWPHATLHAKPNWVEVRCGQLELARFRSTPRDLFNQEPPEPPPTFPPKPPVRGS